MKKKLAYVSSFVDRHGKPRYRFRRTGYPVHYFQEPHGTKAFEREYAACLSTEPAPIGVRRTKPGSVSDVIIRYYADNNFLDLRESTKAVYRGVLERLRNNFGDDPIRQFDSERLARLMTKMRDRPHAAAHGFDPVRDTKPPPNR